MRNRDTRLEAVRFLDFLDFDFDELLRPTLELDAEGPSLVRLELSRASRDDTGIT